MDQAQRYRVRFLCDYFTGHFTGYKGLLHPKWFLIIPKQVGEFARREAALDGAGGDWQVGKTEETCTNPRRGAVRALLSMDKQQQ